MAVLYIIFLPLMLRLQDFDQSAVFSAAGPGNSLRRGSPGRLSLDLGLVGKQGLSLKVKANTVPCLTQLSLISIQGNFREVSVDMTHQVVTLCLHCLPGVCAVDILA